jgi:hypothetical protein
VLVDSEALASLPLSIDRLVDFEAEVLAESDLEA